MKLISSSEYWVFLGILLTGAVVGYGQGSRLWWPEDIGVVQKSFDIAEYMLEYRFKEIKSRFLYAFASDSHKESGDPWHAIIQWIHEFEQSRSEVICGSGIFVFDESMSAFRPRTTKNGNLPHLSWIMRKPEPLGTEFKSVSEAVTGVMMALEITRSKDDHTDEKYDDIVPKLGVSTKVSLRLAEPCMKAHTNTASKAIFLGDSWFGNVPTVVNMKNKLNAHFIGVVKTGHKRYPKKWIETTMQDWPSGTHIVLESQDIDGQTVIAMGYKYNTRNTIFFISSKGAAHTMPGIPYSAEFIRSTDAHPVVRKVPRPYLASLYFENNNCIDKHNHARQYELAVEKAWVTQDGYFRIFSTILGMCVTDAWKAYKHHLPNKAKDKTVTVKKYANILALSLLNNNYSTISSDDSHLFIPTVNSVLNCTASQESMSCVTDNTSSVATPSTQALIPHERSRPTRNTKILTRSGERNKGNREKRVQRKRCVMCQSRGLESRTEYFCSICKVPICIDHSGRGSSRVCFSDHKSAEVKIETEARKGGPDP